MNMVLYTSHCPKCKVLEMKLKQKGIEYQEVDIDPKNLEYLLSQGIQSAPCLKVDNKLLLFKEAIDFVKTLEVR